MCFIAKKGMSIVGVQVCMIKDREEYLNCTSSSAEFRHLMHVLHSKRTEAIPEKLFQLAFMVVSRNHQNQGNCFLFTRMNKTLVSFNVSHRLRLQKENTSDQTGRDQNDLRSHYPAFLRSCTIRPCNFENRKHRCLLDRLIKGRFSLEPNPACEFYLFHV